MTMDFFENSYYKINKQYLSYLGLWPYQAAWKRRLIRTLLTLFMLSIIIPELIMLYEVRGDLNIVFECIPPLGLHTVTFTKCLNSIINREKLKKLLMLMEANWTSRKNENEKDTLRKYAARGRFFTIGYAYYMYISGTLYVVLPLVPIFLDVVKPLNESRPLEYLFRVEYFVDPSKFFVPIFLHALFTTTLSMTVLVAFDAMFGAYVQYGCSLFAELSRELESEVRNNDESLNVSKEIDYTYHHIVRCIKKHKDAIEFCNLLESSYTVYFVFATGSCVFLMSFTGVIAVTKLDDLHLALRHGSFTAGEITYIFCISWHGQLLIDHSLHVNDAVYKKQMA